MLLAALVLVSIDGEHHSLQQLVDLGHCDQSAKMRNVSRLALQQEQEVAVLLCLFIVRKRTFEEV